MGNVTWLVWPQVTCMQKLRYKEMRLPGLITFQRFHLSKKCLAIAASQSCDVLWPSVGLFTYNVIGQWPYQTWKWIKIHICLEWGVGHAKFQLSIANSSGAIARKPSGGDSSPTHFPWPSLVWVSVIGFFSSYTARPISRANLHSGTWAEWLEFHTPSPSYT